MRTLSTFSTFLVTLLFSSAALAESAISLPPWQGEKALDIVETKNITGSCGTAVVRVLGITNIYDNYYSILLDAGKIIVRKGPLKELVLSSDNGVLSDFNGVACVPTKSGNRLLVWSNCGGSACG